MFRVTKMKFAKKKDPETGKNIHDKTSVIYNDANLWATETMGNARYPLELFLRVVTVSLETMKVVNGLPALE